VIVVDYPDLMKIDPGNARLSIDSIYKDLRGIAVERNAAVVVVSQSHRASANAKTVRSDNVAEAYSKIAHADLVLTYSQTEAEHALGLARLHVAAGRNDQDKFTVVISQQYGMGHFVVDSVMMKGTYWENIPRNGPDDEDE
jgi:replicative DNA helicase